MTRYQARLAALVPGIDPRWIEGYMRLEHPTLDNLSPVRFAHEAALASECAAHDGPAMAEQVARSFGL